MRKTVRGSLFATTAAAALVAGLTFASAQTGGGAGGGTATGGGGGHHEMSQGSSGGPGHAQSSGGSLNTQGHSQMQSGRETSERQPSSPGRSGKMTGEDRHERGKAMGEQRGSQEHGLARGEERNEQLGRGQNKTDKQLGNKERNERLGNKDRNERLGTQERNERFGRGERNERLGTQERNERFGRGERNERFGTKRSTGFAREHTGRSVQLDERQRTRIHDVFVRDRARFDRFRVGRVDFDVRPGTRIPRHFHLFALPSDIVSVVPAYRGYRFFYYEDELVIVDPVTLEIVAIIPA